MTKQDSAKRIYAWAFNVNGNRKSGCIELLCAKKLSSIYEASTDYDAAYDEMLAQWSAWRKERRQGWEHVLGTLERMLTMGETALTRPA